MARGKKHTPDQIVSLLRQIEVAVANGKATPVACRDTQPGPEEHRHKILDPFPVVLAINPLARKEGSRPGDLLKLPCVVGLFLDRRLFGRFQTSCRILGNPVPFDAELEK